MNSCRNWSTPVYRHHDGLDEIAVLGGDFLQLGRWRGALVDCGASAVWEEHAGGRRWTAVLRRAGHHYGTGGGESKSGARRAATPAIVDGRIYVRSDSDLYAFGATGGR